MNPNHHLYYCSEEYQEKLRRKWAMNPMAREALARNKTGGWKDYVPNNSWIGDLYYYREKSEDFSLSDVD